MIFKKPVIVYNYPKGIKAFYMRLNDDQKTVAAMDVLMPKVCVLSSGSEQDQPFSLHLFLIKNIVVASILLAVEVFNHIGYLLILFSCCNDNTFGPCCDHIFAG